MPVKTLVQQHRCGCRLFDLRVKWDKGRGRFVAAHGLWKAKKSLLKLMAELNGIAASSPVKTMYLLTYEGECEEGTEVYDNFRNLPNASKDSVTLNACSYVLRNPIGAYCGQVLICRTTLPPMMSWQRTIGRRCFRFLLCGRSSDERQSSAMPITEWLIFFRREIWNRHLS